VRRKPLDRPNSEDGNDLNHPLLSSLAEFGQVEIHVVVWESGRSLWRRTTPFAAAHGRFASPPSAEGAMITTHIAVVQNEAPGD